MKPKNFYTRLMEDHDLLGNAGVDYVTYHSRRLHATYELCIKYLKKGDKVLSIGAAFGSIEKLLAQAGMEVTVIDFPDVIARYQPIYDRYGFIAVRSDLSKDDLGLEHGAYDMLLHSEVIEHLPEAPSSQIQKLKRYIKPKGLFLVSTPNGGSILHISKLFFMLPLYDVPEKFFAPVSEENLGVHRREYLPCEIKSAFTMCAFTTLYMGYFFYTYPKSFKLKFLYMTGFWLSRFRPGMLLIGMNNG